MKKGMSVTLENNKVFYLVDSVTYNNEKFFAATCDENEELYFFKQHVEGENEFLKPINTEDCPQVIDALLQHIQSTFNN